MNSHKKINDTEHQYWNLQALGGCSEKVGDSQQALHYYEQGLSVVRGDKDKAKEASLLTDIAYIYAAKGDQAQMTAYFEQALFVAQTSDDLDASLSVFIRWGHAYSKFGEQTKAFDRYQKALDIARNQGDAETKGRCLSTVAHYYEKREDWPHAIDTYQQILKLTDTHFDDLITGSWKKSRLSFDQNAALTSLGEIYEEIGDIPKALAYMEQALASTTLPATVWKLNDHITRLKQKLNPTTTNDAGKS